jgi:hypothetical protein
MGGITMKISRRSICAQAMCAVGLGAFLAPKLARAGSLNTLLSVPQIAKRSRNNDDWLAGAANLNAWQSEISVGEGNVLQDIRNPQRWRDVFEADAGLAKADLAAFAADAGLVIDARPAFSLSHWHALLVQSGPLWVGVANQAYKAGQVWVVVGISGDGSPAGTEMRVINLESGEVEAISAKKFVDRYEAVGKADGVTGAITTQVLRLA